MIKPDYCTQNDGDCKTCSLVSYGRDCQNKPVKEKSTYYLYRDMSTEMRVEAAKLGLSYPSEFIEMLWEKYKRNVAGE